MKRELRSKEFYKKTVLLGFLFFSFLLVTDFGLYLSNKLILIPIFFMTVCFSIKSLSRTLYINFFIFGYLILVVFFFFINLLFGNDFNLLLFTPVIAYLFYMFAESFGEVRSKIVFDLLVKTLVVAFIVIAIFELAVKLAGIDLLGYKDFLLNRGSKRIDVLRARTLFGSPLSTAALCIFFFVYFSFFRKSYMFLLLSVALAMLSGSRTAIALLMSMVGLLVFLSVYNKRLKLRALVYSFLGLIAFFAAVVYSPVGAIILRSLTLHADQSFLSRSNTTVQTLQDLVVQLPGTLFVGLHGDWISDSAITSIMAGSGILAFLAFIFLFLVLLLKTTLSNFYKFSVVFNIFLGAMMIGGFFVPAVSFLYFLTFLVYSRKTMFNERDEPIIKKIPLLPVSVYP